MYWHKLKKKIGFTLAEMIVVIAIIGILAVVAVPSLYAYIESGNQTKRTNIARSIYLAAQGQLTQMKASKTLSNFSEDFYDDAGKINDLQKVYGDATGVTMPSGEEQENKDYVRYIKKGATTGIDPDDPVVKLLDPIVINKELLKDSICIEYNIETGVVLSVFYSEIVSEFEYNSTENGKNISGTRPYTFHHERKQGYYGGEGTGEMEKDPLPTKVEIYDGNVKPLIEDNGTYKNILYAEILVPNTAKEYSLHLFGENKSTPLSREIYIDFSNINLSLPTTLNFARNAPIGNDIIYQAKSSPLDDDEIVVDGVDIKSGYSKYIWVIDYVGGDMVKDYKKFSIGNNFKNSDNTLLKPQNIRAGIKDNSALKFTVSSKYANSHFGGIATAGTSSDDIYYLKSARHLNNIRYFPESKYRQLGTIKMKNDADVVENFEPIKDFSGTYLSLGTDYFIENLKINTVATDSNFKNVGLFANVIDEGTINGISLKEAVIIAKGNDNVGGLVGNLEKGTITRSSVFANISASGMSNQPISVGGIAGTVSSDSKIEQCYNGGFFNALNRSETNSENNFGSVTLTGTYGDNTSVHVGGIAGKNSGLIRNVYNNARVNIKDVNIGEKSTEDKYLSILKDPTDSFADLTAKKGYLGGIAGANTGNGKILGAYATNYVAIYEGSLSGGIVGSSDKDKSVAESYYITNGCNDDMQISKEELAKATNFPSKFFVKSSNSYSQGKNTNNDYPYPMLKGVAHTTGFEDIKEVATVKSNFGYYELYSDNTWGFSFDGTLAKQNKIVVADGYYIDFQASSGTRNRYEVKVNDTLVLSSADDWKWNNKSKTLNSKPIKFNGKDGKEYYRLFLNNGILEESQNGQIDKGVPQKIEFLHNGNNVFSGSRKTYAGGAVSNFYFNPLFGNTVELSEAPPLTKTNFEIRSPRHLDNIDSIPSLKYTQTFDLDFKLYKREILTDTSIEPNIALPNENTGMDELKSSVVEEVFSGTYDGRNRYIRNVSVNVANGAGGIGSKVGIGLFAEVNGTILNVALIESDFEGFKDSVGSIAGKVLSGGLVKLCEVSHVTVTGSGGGSQNIGGVVGLNSQGGTVQNVYFNHSYRNEQGLFSSPVMAEKNNNKKYMGGLIGNQQGTFENAYTTAIGPDITDTGKNPKPAVGIGIIGSNVYYLSTVGYNYSVDSSNNFATSIHYDDEEGWKTDSMFKGNENWVVATAETTKLTVDQGNNIYPYPTLKGMNHYLDWPLLMTTLRYYEKYNDNTFGYYYYLNNTGIPVDTLKNNEDLYVIEEGYLMDLISEGTFNVRFGGEGGTLIPKSSFLFDKRLIIKLTHMETENILNSNQFTDKGVIPTKVEISMVGTEFNDLLHGNDRVYFNPMFPKQISVKNDDVVPPPEKTFEVRSPRHMANIGMGSTLGGENPVTKPPIWVPALGFKPTTITPMVGTNKEINIDGYTAYETIVKDIIRYKRTVKVVGDNPGRMEEVLIQDIMGDKKWKIQSVKYWEGEEETEVANSLNSKIFSYDQTMDIDFALYEKDGAKLEVKNNVIKDFKGIYYDGKISGAIDPETRRIKSYNIKNLTMNVPHGEYFTNVGSTFGNISNGSSVKNLEFINPQIRYGKNSSGNSEGMGGGIVSNINYGKIDNIKVYNDKQQPLFANVDGKTDNVFCADRSKGNFNNPFKYAHSHGGIAAITSGPSALISNCVVGTNASSVEEIYNNKTIVSCYSQTPNVGLTDYGIRVGGIVGSIANGSKVISCTNIAQITPNLSKMDSLWASTHIIGGIAGDMVGGNASENTGKYSGEIIGCYNAGSVKLSFGFVGGIVGTGGGTADKSARIISCYNTGRINIETDNDVFNMVTPKNGVSLRIGGISGETGNAEFLNCYNIGYLSGNLPKDPVTSNSRAAGAIFGLASSGDTRIENCFSLAADQFRPESIVGENLFTDNNGNILATVNGINDKTVFKTLFGNFWESRAKLRDNEILTSTTYQIEPYPGLNQSWRPGASKDYPVFSTDDSFYIYPSLSKFTYDGVEYTNPHITPWEYIDSYYDATFKYYEKYTDGSFGQYYLDLKGKPHDTLRNDLKVIDDGYFIELGMGGQFTVVINGNKFSVRSSTNIAGMGDIIGLQFTSDMKKAFTQGYNQLRVFTALNESGTNGEKNKEANKINRLIGTSTVAEGTTGKDLFVDINFPKEVKYAEAMADKSKLKPDGEKYAIRSVRHINSIETLINASGNLTKNRNFKQETDIDFSVYVGTIDGFTNKKFTRPVVRGEFYGIYDGNEKTLENVEINNNTTNKAGLFEVNRGTIQSLNFESPSYVSTFNNDDVTMGIVAAENMGSIKKIAVYNPHMSANSSDKTLKLGTITGENTGTSDNIARIEDANVVCEQYDNPYIDVGVINAPRDKEGTGVIEPKNKFVGGIAGNAGANSRISRCIYIAEAPKDTGDIIYPIVGNATEDTVIGVDEVYYLTGTEFNESSIPIIGKGQITSEFAKEPIIVTTIWPLWERDFIGAGTFYPYPILKSMTTPVTYPVKEKISIKSVKSVIDDVETELTAKDENTYVISIPQDSTKSESKVGINSTVNINSVWIKISKEYDNSQHEIVSRALTEDELKKLKGVEGFDFTIPLLKRESGDVNIIVELFNDVADVNGLKNKFPMAKHTIKLEVNKP